MPDLNFNANEWEPTKSFDPIPADWYTVIITDSKLKPTNAGDGEYLELTLQVVEGPHQNRLLWDRLNLVNPNEKAVQIAKGTLSAICRSVGKMGIQQSEELHNLPLRAKVIVENRADTGEPANKVKGYKSIQGEPAASEPAQRPAPSGPAKKPEPVTTGRQNGGGKAPAPWAKKA